MKVLCLDGNKMDTCFHRDLLFVKMYWHQAHKHKVKHTIKNFTNAIKENYIVL